MRASEFINDREHKTQESPIGLETAIRNKAENTADAPNEEMCCRGAIITSMPVVRLDDHDEMRLRVQ
jgi:hypothetical protein